MFIAYYLKGGLPLGKSWAELSCFEREVLFASVHEIHEKTVDPDGV